MPVLKQGTFLDPNGEPYTFPAVLDVIFGADRGNTFTKIYAIFPDGTHMYYLMPSLVAPGSWSQLQEMRQGIRQQQTTERRDLVITYKDLEYFAGWTAYAQVREATSGQGDQLRYYSDEALLCCMAAMSALVEEYEERLEQYLQARGYERPLAGDDRVYFHTIHADLVTSVPVKYYNATNRKEIRAKFRGTHSCEVNGKPRVFAIAYKQTIMEGGGLEVLAAGMPEVDLSQPSNTITIDGGGDTVDFVKSSPDDVIVQECDTIRQGVERIADLINGMMNREYARPLTRQERQSILNGFVTSTYTQDITAYPRIAVDPVSLSFVPPQKLHTWVEAARRNVAGQIISKASSLWDASHGKVAPDILKGRAFFIGGETYLVGDLIVEAIPQIIIPNLPELANAQANAYIAQAMAEE